MNTKKAQGLPLNLIILSIILIITMVLIIVFVSSRLSDTASTLDEQAANIRACDVSSNPVLNSRYQAVFICSADEVDDTQGCIVSPFNQNNFICQSYDQFRIKQVPGVKLEENAICCGVFK